MGIQQELYEIIAENICEMYPILLDANKQKAIFNTDVWPQIIENNSNFIKNNNNNNSNETKYFKNHILNSIESIVNNNNNNNNSIHCHSNNAYLKQKQPMDDYAYQTFSVLYFFLCAISQLCRKTHTHTHTHVHTQITNDKSR